MTTRAQGSLLRNRARLETVESEWLRLTRQRYYAMVKRFESQYDGHGRLAVVGFTVPFSLVEFRNWIERSFPTIEHTAECEYCGNVVTIYDVEIDHKIPPVQNGSIGLENLALACERCNQQKGPMTDHAYRALRELALDRLQFSIIDCESVLGRLQRCLKQDKNVNSLEKQLAALRYGGWKHIRMNPAGRIRGPR